MKKTLIIALAGLMMFAFTQCGGGNKKEKEDKTETKAVEETNTVEGTQQYTEMKSAFDEIEKAINNATTCDELEEAAFALGLGSLAASLSDEQNDAEEKMTEKEQNKIEELTKKLSEAVEKKAEELGCEKKEYSL